MDQIVSKYAHLMDRMAIPLIEALYNTGKESASGEEFARSFAALLSQSVTLGGELAKRFDLTIETQDDRMAATVTAAKILSSSLTHTGKMPGPDDHAVALSSLDGLMGFAEDFIHDLDEDLSSHEAVRPTDILGSGAALITAVYGFPFGREPAGMMSELTLGLRARMKKWMRMLTMDDQQPTDRLHMMRAGMLLLTDSYHWRVRMIQESSAPADAESALRDIWAQLDEKLEMLKTILGFIDGAATPSSAKAAQPAKDTAPVLDAPKVEVKSDAGQADEKAEDGGDDSASPMSFFVKKTG